MRFYGFFSNTTFVGEKFQHIYLYGNNTSSLTFRSEYFKWWWKHQGYEIIEADTFESYRPEVGLFTSLATKPQCLILKKAPKRLDALSHTCLWHATHTKHGGHEVALKAPSVASIPCYDIKLDEMTIALASYLEKEFSKKVDRQLLVEAARNLCEKPAFFFSEAYKVALGAPCQALGVGEEDLMGGLRLDSALTLRKLKTSPEPHLWAHLKALRSQEQLFKSGSSAAQGMMEFIAHL